MNKYDDIINLEHFEPKNHPRMDIESRAAQFASFAALAGYSDHINEKGRLTNKKHELTEEEKNTINKQLHIIINKNVNITYFVKDKYKSGGSYKNITGKVRKIDSIEQKIIFYDKQTIKFDDIIKIDIEKEI